MKLPGKAVPWVTACVVLVLDRLTKITFAAYLAGDPIEIIPGIFRLSLVHNTGAAFGILEDQKALFIILSISVIAYIVGYLLRKGEHIAPIAVSLGLILGGALGNLIDRIFFGFVIDFLDFRIWPVFNIADSCITIGAVLMILHMVLKDCAAHTNR